MELPKKLEKKLDERRSVNAYRELQLPVKGRIDFSSNDYLGIVKNALLVEDFERELATGSTGSRLLTGHSELFDITEQKIATFHQAPSALLFNSGYDANLGVLSSIPQKGDTILYDSLCHASLRDGIRLSNAKAFSFRHNDLDDLKKKLQHAEGDVYLVTESVFSMDGNMCPLQDILNICNEKGAYLILDEAHAIGVIGEQGEGLSQHLQLHESVFCRIYTFGKACGCHGAAVVGSQELRNYLVNFARSFMYTTALSPHSVKAIAKSYDVFPKRVQERSFLQELIQAFHLLEWRYETQSSFTPIQAIFIPGNENVKRVATNIQMRGFDVRPILSPTVPQGKERLRVILHAFNTKEEIQTLSKLINVEYK